MFKKVIPILFIGYLFSQTTGSHGNSLAAFLPFVLIGLIFYFLILRPQTKEKKQHESMIANLKKGDKILTRGGLYGKIINFQGKNNQKISIDLGSGVKVNISRSYVVSLSEKNESN